MWRNKIHCDICQFHYNGNALAEALKVVEYHWYRLCKRRGVRSLDIDTRVWVRQRTDTKFYTYMCARARRDQIAEEEGSRTCSMHKGNGKLGRKIENKRPRGRSRRRWEFNIKRESYTVRCLSGIHLAKDSDEVFGTLSRIVMFHERQELFSQAEQASLWHDNRTVIHHTVTPLKMEPTLVTETSEVKTQTPGKFPEEPTLGL
jgi:hypothetical protein